MEFLILEIIEMKNKKVGHPYSTKEQIKGLLTFIVIMVSICFAIVGNSKIKAAPQAENLKSVETGVIASGWSHIKNRYYNNTYPESVEDRHSYIVEYLVWNFPELTNEEINNLVNIAGKESGAHDPKIEPRTWVKHCQRLNSTYYAIEFGECDYKEVHREKSTGIFQILPSTYKGYKCEGSIEDVDNQINCAVKIYQKSGYGAWYTSSKKLGII